MFKDRIQKTAALLSEYHIDTLLIEDPINISYLTGLDISAGSLLIGKKNALFLDGRYYEALKDVSPVKAMPLEAFSKELGKRLGFDQEKTSYARFLSLQKCIGKGSLHPVENIVKNKVRLIKSQKEIALMKEAADLGAKGFTHALKLLKTGISEEEVAQAIKIFWLENGADGTAFDPIIAFGANSANPHHRPTPKKLKKGDIVLIDLGVSLNKYASDMTRVVFFGKPKAQLISIYEIVHEACEKAIKLCAPGTPISSLDKAARSLIAKFGYADYFTHSLGHGIGLEVHEAPNMSKTAPKKGILEEGMALTIEPGIYLPSIGGVRIEDTIIITKNGSISITPLSKEIIIIN